MRRYFETPKSLKPGQVAFDGALPLHQAQGVNGTSPEVQPVHLRCPPSQACGRAYEAQVQGSGSLPSLALRFRECT